MIKTTCFGQHWPSSGFSSERFVHCKCVYTKHAAYKSYTWKTSLWSVLAETCSFYHFLININ